MNSNRFLQGLFENWPAKVLSLFAALLLVVFFKINQLEERTISVPLQLVLNKDYVPARDYPETVRLLLRGDAKAIFTVIDTDLLATADFSGILEAGTARVSVKVEKKASALNIDPLQIVTDPGEIALALERRLTAIVPVVPAFRGVLESGYEIITYSIVPDTLEISGPESLVNRMRDVTTEYIELSGRSADFSTSVGISHDDSLVSFSGPEGVEFHAAVQKTLMTQDFADLPLRATGLLPGLAISGKLPSGSVKLLGARSEMAAFQAPENFLFIDLSPLRTPGSYTIPVRVNVPPGISVEIFSPLAVTIELVNTGVGP